MEHRYDEAHDPDFEGTDDALEYPTHDEDQRSVLVERRIIERYGLIDDSEDACEPPPPPRRPRGFFARRPR